MQANQGNSIWFGDAVDVTSPIRWHELLIIGNGFDLECGLKSSFEDFWTYRQPIVDDLTNVPIENKVTGEWARQCEKQGVNAWDFIFKANASHKCDGWCDVEEILKQWVLYPYHIHSTIKIINMLYKEGVSSLKGEVDHTIEYGTLARRVSSGEFTAEAALVLYMVSVLSDTTTKRRVSACSRMGRPEINSFMLAELKVLELSFCDYLNRQVEDTADYQQKAICLTQKLLDHEKIQIHSSRIIASVLSFNYTQPVAQIMSKHLSWSNIHGNLAEKNIMFGVDGQDINEENIPTSNGDSKSEVYDSVVPFTKTYRLMSLDGPKRKALVHPDTNLQSGSICTDLIKFYGHSLAEADYSYFQALFDTINLYEGSTRLIFYFNPEVQDFQDQLQNIHRLINKYGRTLDNADHAHNLLHKLLLEGRLSVHPISIDPIQ